MGLFPEMLRFPAGFSYHSDFLSVDEEAFFLGVVAGIPLHTFVFQGYEAKRKVESFGYDYSFERQSLTKGKEIPSLFKPLLEKVARIAGVEASEFSELLVTGYPVGAVINWHRDAFPFDLIAGVSLKADCIFKLRPHAKEKQGRGSVISVPVRRRSLYVIQGEARYQWQHSTAPVKEMRYSITLRTLRKET
jgi:alkylated DNA repair dioxygenase AlkB